MSGVPVDGSLHGGIPLDIEFAPGSGGHDDDMARITVEDCLERVPNRFELVLLGARRAKQLLKGARPLVDSDNKEIVTALREIAAEKVRLQHNS